MVKHVVNHMVIPVQRALTVDVHLEYLISAQIIRQC